MCAHVFLHGDGWELYVSITCVAACGKCCHTLCAPFIVNSHCNRDRAAAAKLEPHISDHVVVRPQSVVLSFPSFLTLGNCCSLTKCFFHTIFSFFNIRTHRLFTYFSLCRVLFENGKQAELIKAQAVCFRLFCSFSFFYQKNTSPEGFLNCLFVQKKDGAQS